LKKGEHVLLIGNGKRYFAKVEKGDLHTDVGVFKLDSLMELQYGDTISSHLGFELRIHSPRLPDFFNHLKRSGAPISPKDIGMIISHIGLGKNDVVLDAGTGSGIMAIYLGYVAKRVVTYEVREEFLEIANSNIELVGLENVELRFGDLINEIRSIDEIFDAVTLDMHQSAQVIPLVPKVLKPGGYVVVFTPFLEQAKEVRNAINEAGFEETITLECTQREISFSERGTRPSTTRVGYTGFITFTRMP
jgi:tRNA (adenine57-N1/adenine58-N1)-methyltransferase